MQYAPAIICIALCNNESNPKPHLPFTGYSTSTNLSKISIDDDNNNKEKALLKLLSTLDEHKGAGSDGISPFFIKSCAKTLLKPISIIFTRSFNEEIELPIWKTAHIVLVHKKVFTGPGLITFSLTP
ncbi:unnamed protein product [Leptidea sinapis]|uniref:Reverse transcriptase domain-containing protein n=1 Tax=Leptidea sinapis TaxID=189913 RepID=A0A5E4QIB1_9NEOP|nr:unnamed protein product [Leptidea sinapis]